MKDPRTQRIDSDHPAYSLNLIINSDQPGLLDSSGQFIVPSLFSFEQNGEFIPGYPSVIMGVPQKQPKFLFTIRDLAGDKKLKIHSWKLTAESVNGVVPFEATFPVSSEDVEKDVIGQKKEKQYYTYTIFETRFKGPKFIVLEGYRLTIEANLSRNGEDTVLLFVSDPEMIIDDNGSGT